MEKKLLWLYLNRVLSESGMRWSELESSISDFVGTTFHKRYFSRLKDGTLQFQSVNNIYRWITQVYNPDFSFELAQSLLGEVFFDEAEVDELLWIELPASSKSIIHQHLSLSDIGISSVKILLIEYLSQTVITNMEIIRIKIDSTDSLFLYFAQCQDEFIWLNRDEKTLNWFRLNASLNLNTDNVVEYICLVGLCLRQDGVHRFASIKSLMHTKAGRRLSKQDNLDFRQLRKKMTVTETETAFVCEYDVIVGSTIFRERAIIGKDGDLSFQKLSMLKKLDNSSRPYRLPSFCSSDFSVQSKPQFEQLEDAISRAVFKELRCSFTALTLAKTIELQCDHIHFIRADFEQVVEDHAQKCITVFSPDIDKVDLELLTFRLMIASRRFEQGLLGFVPTQNKSVVDWWSVVHAKNIDMVFFALKAIEEMSEPDRERYERIIKMFELDALRQAFRDGWSKEEVTRAYRNTFLL